MALVRKTKSTAQIDKVAQLINHLNVLMVNVLIFTMVKHAQLVFVQKRNLINALMVFV